MLKFVCAAVAAGVLAGTALAADPNNGGGQAGPGLVAPGGAQGNPGAWSYAKNDRILKYLGLTQEQCDKIDALYKDKNAAVAELYKGLRQNANGGRQGLDPAAMKDIQDKVKALEEAFKTKLLDVLTADQKTKYEAADKAWTEYQKTLSTAYGSLGKDLSPQERQKAIREAQEKALAALKDELAKIFGAAFKADDFKPYGSGQPNFSSKG